MKRLFYWAPLLFLIYTMVSQISWSLLPIVVWLNASDWQVQPHRVSATITGWKVLDCQFVANTEDGYVRQNGFWVKTAFHFEHDSRGETSRPLGRQSFGVWAWTPDSTAPVTEVLLRVEHVCGGGQVRISEVGPFAVPNN